jgi:Big-like domain-containing protein/dockerin type I repeat protein
VTDTTLYATDALGSLTRGQVRSAFDQYLAGLGSRWVIYQQSAFIGWISGLFFNDSGTNPTPYLRTDGRGNTDALFAVAQGLRALPNAANYKTVAGHDWLREFSVYLIRNQRSDGLWLDTPWVAGATVRSPTFFGDTFTALYAALTLTEPTDDLTSPAAATAEFHFQSSPHTLSVRFSEDVSDSLRKEDLQVLTLPGGPAVTPTRVDYDAATNTATFVFDGALPNGNYRATLAADAVADASGNPLAASFAADFFVLAGDVNRDRSVNGTDFAILAGNFGKSGIVYAGGDLNGDGFVNGSDFAILAGNFGRSVPPPAAAVTRAPAAVSVPSSARPAPPAASRPKRSPQRLPLPRSSPKPRRIPMNRS